ncbi:RtcB family protein [Paraconexibacter sp. AEG42_29]|uniref:RtcB family protein n=1 Tax=Paraconexibacter sp. AEG42_29 TaxID=2997339 RepID=UPI00339D5FFC
MLANGTRLTATPDHEVRTPAGWREAGTLRRGDSVACLPFAGLPHTVPTGELAIDAPTRADALAARGLWPLRAADTRLPALLRLFGTLIGDGHLARNGKAVSWYTVVPADAAAIAADLERVGFRASIHVRERGARRRDEHCVRCSSVDLHALLAAMGCPVGRKVDGWPANPLGWVLDLEPWQRALVLSGFASAEATTAALRQGGIANVAIKQAGTTRHAIDFVVRLLGSLGFDASVTVSGPVRGAVTTWVIQVLGGTDAQLRFFCEVGFCHAAEKRVTVAAVTSVAWQREAERAHRRAAIAAAHTLRSRVPNVRVRDLVGAVATEYTVPRSLVHHGLDGRGIPRSVSVLTPDHCGEVVWVPVVGLADAGTRDVYDVVTGDAAAGFVADGVCVHNCGNKAVRTALRTDDVIAELPRIMDEVFERISFGVGRKNDEPVDHPVLDAIFKADFHPQRRLFQSARNQLGTVGAGNHYVDLFAGDDGHVWVGVHFGSRGFGHKTASGFLSLAGGGEFGDRAPDGEMDAPPTLLHVESELGQSYIAAMELAGAYAYAGRDVVVDKVLEILGTESTFEVHNHPRGFAPYAVA